MSILAIDPGCDKSGYVIINRDLTIREHGHLKNYDLLHIIKSTDDIDTVVIEMMTSYGMAIGKTSMDTLVWIGIFHHGFVNESKLLSRKDIKMHLCNSVRAKDKNITVAVKDRYTPYGGGNDPWKGIASKPGPLYGFKSHIFSALAVGIAYIEGCELYKMGM